MKRLILAVVLVAATAGSGPPALADAMRVEIPITQKFFGDRLLHYSVPVSVGGAPVEAMLDSGSTGLRLLPGAAPEGSFKRTATQSTYSYLVGVELKGPFAKAKVSLGGLESDKEIYVQSVSKIGCVAKKPDCPASRVSQEAFRLGSRGIPHEGYMAIIGTGLRPAGVVNPLTEIGDGVWIITLPKPGAAAPGALILNPTADERAGYTLFSVASDFKQTPVGAIRGWRDVVPACLIDISAKRSVCSRAAVLDTGAPGIHVRARKAADRDGWRPGAQAALSFPTPGDPLISEAFLIGRQPGAGVTSVRPDGDEPDALLLGVLAYYSFSVLYDSKAGTIGLKRRTD